VRCPGRPAVALCALLLASVASATDAGVSVQAPPFALGLPGKSWQLLVELPGFAMEPVQQLAAGARVLGARDDSGLSVSLTLALSPGDPSPRSCRDHDWAGRQKGTPLREDTRLSAQGDTARVEFLLPGSGAGVQQKHVLLYLQRDGVCAIVHLSEEPYRAQDAEGLERLLASARLGS
jgi:hypothetical protein